MTEPVPDLSIVIPMFNEHGNVDYLAERLTGVLDALPETYEIVLVDDGSRDATWADICDAAAKYPGLRGLRLSRNFGHQAALMAGLKDARGHAVVSMDGDLQHPPEVVPQLVEAWRAGDEIVSTTRTDTEVVGPLKRISSAWFYRFFSWLSGVPMRPGSSDFRLMDRKVVDEICGIPNNEIFLRGMVEWVGFKRSNVPFVIADRHSGVSKYSLRKMLRLASSGLVSFSVTPLRLGIWVGAVTSALAFLYLFYAAVQFFFGHTVPGWASTIGVLSLLFGVLFMILGIMGVYIARMHEVLTGRPGFIVAERRGGDRAAGPPDRT